MLAAVLLTVVAGGLFAEVQPDPGGAAGVVRGRVDIDAPPQVVWTVIRDCSRASRMAPNVKSCRVLDKSKDGGWDVREMIVQAPLTPKVRTVFRSDYEPVRRIRFRCTGGDVKMCEGEWTLTALPNGGTRVTYVNRATAPFAVPPAITRAVMKADVTSALKALRRESQSAAR